VTDRQSFVTNTSNDIFGGAWQQNWLRLVLTGNNNNNNNNCCNDQTKKTELVAALRCFTTSICNFNDILLCDQLKKVAFSACSLQCFDAVGWAAGRASGL